MVFSWFNERRRKMMLAEPMPPAWFDYLVNNVRHYQHLPPGRQARVRRVVKILVAEKNWVGGSGFEVTEEMKVTVAGQAAILVIGMPEPYYFDRVHSIIIYPGPYEHPPMIGGPRTMLGEAWFHGPIVLSWRETLAGGRNERNGRNLVFHEFAHYVDALDGEVDGTPPLVDRRQQRAWHRVTEAEYLRLLGKARRNEASLLDHYGAKNRAEFFAVATECFFEQPRALLREHKQLYRVLRDLYRQHPARWLPDAIVTDKKRRAVLTANQERRLRRHRRKRLLVLRSQRPEKLFALAIEYFNERRYLLAAATATRVMALSPGDGEAYVHRAMARFKRGRFAAALDDADEALHRDPDDAEALAASGAALVELGEYEPAMEDINRAIALDHDDAEVRYYRGRAWTGLGQPAQAVKDFARSLAKRPLAAAVLYHNGLAFKALGNAAEAKASLAKALQLEPTISDRTKLD